MCQPKDTMKAHVEVVCYKYKPLKDGTYPLMLRITKSRKRKYVSIGLSIDPKYWDFDKNKPKRNCPDKEKIEKLIATKVTEYNALILDLATEQREYTPETLVNTLNNKVQARTVDEMYNHIIDNLRKNGRLGNAEVYNYSLNSIREFSLGSRSGQFRDIDIAWLKRYEEWLKKRGCRETTISHLFRTLRSVFNKAIENGIVKRDYYPFEKYKVSKFDISTNKRAITKEDVYRIRELNLSDKPLYMQLAQDMFIFSYFGAGINFSDIAQLRFANIKDGRVYYTRKKTSKQVNFMLNDIAQGIIDKYASPFWDDEDYIFPILDVATHKTEQQRHDRIHKSLKKVNRELRKIGDTLGIDNLTTYVARHNPFSFNLKINQLQKIIIE